MSRKLWLKPAELPVQTAPVGSVAAEVGPVAILDPLVALSTTSILEDLGHSLQVAIYTGFADTPERRPGVGHDRRG